MKPIHVTDWEFWKELGEFYKFDPYENVNHGIDEGGGNSTDFEFIGDIPKKEE